LSAAPWKVTDTHQGGRIIQTFDVQADAIGAATRYSAAGWPGRFLASPMAADDRKRPGHIKAHCAPQS
jgi:hypothetical protein